MGDGGGDAPVMPLTPCYGIGGVGGGDDGQGASGVLAVYVEGDRATAIGSVEEISGVGGGFGDFNGDIEPFAGLGPANVELIFRGQDDVVGIVVNVVVEFGVGDVHAFV